MRTLFLALALVLPVYAGEQSMQWDDNSQDEDGFVIYRSIDGIDFVEIGNVGRNVTKFTDKNVPVGYRVSYRVTAFNKWGESDPSNALTIGSEVPNGPTKLRKPDEDFTGS